MSSIRGRILGNLLPSNINHEYENTSYKPSLKSPLHRLLTFPLLSVMTEQKLFISLASSGFYQTKGGYSIQCFYCTLEILISGIMETLQYYKTKHKIDIIHKCYSHNCPLFKKNNLKANVDCIITRKTNESKECYKSEAARLFTFLNNSFYKALKNNSQSFWTLHDLAKHGFYYTGDSDKCICAFCGIILYCNAVSSFSDIYKHSCEYKKNEEIGNIPLGFEDL